MDVYQSVILQIQQHLKRESTPVIPSIKYYLLDFEVNYFM